MSKYRAFPRVLLFALCVFASSQSFAAARTFVPQMPRDFSKVDVYLLTVARGEAVYARYGHNIIRFVDRGAGTDYNFNWGIFDFQTPGFALKFYTGVLDYMMATQGYQDLIQHYRQFEKRRVVQDRINLTDRQKAQLMSRIRWNARPENVRYKYHYFYNNCSTKVRDYLDEALGGVIKARFSGEMAGHGFRKNIRENTLGLWWSYIGLDLMSNSLLDREVSKWEEMFLPELLRTYVSKLPAFDDQGRPVPGMTLLSDAKVVVDLPVPEGGVDPYQVALLLFGVPAAAAALLLSRGKRGRGLRTLGTALFLYGLASGFWGLILTANWLFSGHAELHHNANLWLFWPIDWAFAFGGFRLAVSGRTGGPGSYFWRGLRALALLHLASLFLMIVLWATGGIVQDVTPVLGGFGVAAVLVYVMLLRHGLDTGEGVSGSSETALAETPKVAEAVDGEALSSRSHGG